MLPADRAFNDVADTSRGQPAQPEIFAPGSRKPRRRASRAAFPFSWFRRSACCPHVDLALGQRRQLLVGRLFLIQRLLQDAGAVVAAELLGPGDQAAVAR